MAPTSSSRSHTKTGIRLVAVLCALVVMAMYTLLTKSPQLSQTIPISYSTKGLLGNLYTSILIRGNPRNSISNSVLVHQRHLLSFDDDSDYYDNDPDTPTLGDSDNDNCTDPRGPHEGYNDSCSFVLDNCEGEVTLINYMAFVLCDLANVQVLGFILLALWLLYLISLLATTADNFFVPPLNLLSDKLRLSPSIAGITLLAIGNGAPDVFTAYAALRNNDIQLLLGALIGASIFISTVVLGTIILVVKIEKNDIDRIDFVRDVVAYIITVAAVIGVAFDGEVRLVEAVLFPLIYFVYLGMAVTIAYIRRSIANKRKKQESPILDETSPLLAGEQPLLSGSSRHTQTGSGNGLLGQDDSELVVQINASIQAETEEPKKERLTLLGLTWPWGANIFVKIQWLLEWPFSLLRWISIPPCYYDNQWTEWHHYFVVTSPIPMMMVLLIAAQGWNGFTDYHVGTMPLYVFLIFWGFILSSSFYFIVRSDKPPHWSIQIVLGILAFVMSIAWLNIEANEVVAVLQAFGLLFGIDTAILGLTVLAIGNSVGDWVADTAVARAGKPGMGIASCFGSPLLNDVLGLSVALLAKMATNGGQPFSFPIHSAAFDRVKLSWIFLGISLISSVVIIPLFKFSPPKPFGVALVYLYLVFMVFSVLSQLGIMDIHFPV